jgi:hypothetical protein
VSESHEITLVAPNGAKFEQPYRAQETVERVLDHAVKEFGRRHDLDPNKPYVLAYDGAALENSLTLAAAGVPAGAQLNVRSKAIPGDGACIRS